MSIVLKPFTKLTILESAALERAFVFRSDEGLKLKTSLSETLYDGQLTLPIQSIKPNNLFANSLTTVFHQKFLMKQIVLV